MTAQHLPRPFQATWSRALFSADVDRGRVETLLAQVPGATIFNTLEWLEPAARALSPARSLLVLYLEKNGRLVAWVPLSAGRERLHGLPLRSLRLLGYPYTDRTALLMMPGDAELAREFLAQLHACPASWDVALLSELHDGGEHALIATALGEHPALRHQWRHCSRSPVLDLRRGSSSALRANYGKTLDTRLRRSRKKLAEKGAARFVRLQPHENEVPPLVDAIKAVEEASWKGKGDVGLFTAADTQAFFSEVAARFAARGWLDIGLLYLDERLISYRFGFRYGGVFLDYNLAYDAAYSGFSPGRILLDDLVTSSFEAGLAAVDASRSSMAEPHLLSEWPAGHIDHHELWVFNATLRGLILSIARRRLQPLMRRVRARLRRHDI